MRILAIVQGEYGWRIATNIRQHSPPDWTTTIWQAPPLLPPVIDYPEDFLPEALAPSDLVLSLGQHPGVAELLPDVVSMCGARAVIVPVDNIAWLPPGLMHQVARWLRDLNVSVVFPKPFCSLTPTTYNTLRQRVKYDNEMIAGFARCFGQPEFRATQQTDGSLSGIQVHRDTPCGCARYVACNLTQTGICPETAEQDAGLLHHHYPCLAGMSIDLDYSDTLMHVSGNILKAAISDQIKPFRRPTTYYRPHGLNE